MVTAAAAWMPAARGQPLRSSGTRRAIHSTAGVNSAQT